MDLNRLPGKVGVDGLGQLTQGVHRLLLVAQFAQNVDLHHFVSFRCFASFAGEWP